MSVSARYPLTSAIRGFALREEPRELRRRRPAAGGEHPPRLPDRLLEDARRAVDHHGHRLRDLLDDEGKKGLPRILDERELHGLPVEDAAS